MGRASSSKSKTNKVGEIQMLRSMQKAISGTTRAGSSFNMSSLSIITTSRITRRSPIRRGKRSRLRHSLSNSPVPTSHQIKTSNPLKFRRASASMRAMPTKGCQTTIGVLFTVDKNHRAARDLLTTNSNSAGLAKREIRTSTTRAETGSEAATTTETKGGVVVSVRIPALLVAIAKAVLTAAEAEAMVLTEPIPTITTTKGSSPTGITKTTPSQQCKTVPANRRTTSNPTWQGSRSPTKTKIKSTFKPTSSDTSRRSSTLNKHSEARITTTRITLSTMGSSSTSMTSASATLTSYRQARLNSQRSTTTKTQSITKTSITSITTQTTRSCLFSTKTSHAPSSSLCRSMLQDLCGACWFRTETILRR